MVTMVTMVKGCFLSEKKVEKKYLSLEYKEEKFRSEFGEKFGVTILDQRESKKNPLKFAF